MAQDNAERFPIGRTALGGAACGFSYDAAMQDAEAREKRLRRPLRFGARPLGDARREAAFNESGQRPAGLKVPEPAN